VTQQVPALRHLDHTNKDNQQTAHATGFNTETESTQTIQLCTEAYGTSTAELEKHTYTAAIQGLHIGDIGVLTNKV
jgi:hypothetical protein